MSALSLVSAPFSKLPIHFVNDIFSGDLFRISLIFIVNLFFGFSFMILSYTLIFTHIAASNTANVAVTITITYRIFSTYLLCFSAHFIV